MSISNQVLAAVVPDSVETAQLHKHKLWTEAEILQQQLVTTEGRIGFFPQAVIVIEAHGFAPAIKLMTFSMRPGMTRIHSMYTPGHCQMQRRTHRTLCVKEYGDLVDPGFTPVHFFRAFEAQTDSRAAIGFSMQAGICKVERL